MNPKTGRSLDPRVAEEAAEWVTRLESASADQRGLFVQWITESPLHLREFLYMAALSDELRALEPEHGQTAEALRQSLQSNVIQLPIFATQESDDSSVARPRRLTWRHAAAICGAALLGLLGAVFLARGREEYLTEVGEHRTVQLADGSTIYLNAKTRVLVKLRPGEREIRLLDGEALFSVEHDPKRPFRVLAGSNVIQAVGTQFDVNRLPSATVVAVIEGRVQISGPSSALGIEQPSQSADQLIQTNGELDAGQEARIDGDGRIQKRSLFDSASVISWHKHRLVFHDDTLEDIAAEFNRYNNRGRIRLETHEARARRYTAVFNAEDPQSLVDYLRRDPTLVVATQGSEFIVRSERAKYP